MHGRLCISEFLIYKFFFVFIPMVVIAENYELFLEKKDFTIYLLTDFKFQRILVPEDTHGNCAGAYGFSAVGQFVHTRSLNS